MATATVSVKSSFASKINWAQAVSFAAMLLTALGIDMDAETQKNILAGIIGAQSVVTWVLRTWFTTAITPSSIEN